MAKTLESSIADRLDRMSSVIPTDRDALVNYLSILRPATIEEDHDRLTAAVKFAANEVGLSADPQVALVLLHIASEKSLVERLIAREQKKRA